MGFFDWLFGGSSKANEIAEGAVQIGAAFLDQSDVFDNTVFTFSEITSFIYFESDYSLFVRKNPNRNAYVDAIADCFKVALRQSYGQESVEPHVIILNARNDLYGQMIRAKKEKSDIVEKLEFFLSQATTLGDYHHESESPLGLKGIMDSFQGKQEMVHFYTKMLIPYIKGRMLQ